MWNALWCILHFDAFCVMPLMSHNSFPVPWFISVLIIILFYFYIKLVCGFFSVFIINRVIWQDYFFPLLGSTWDGIGEWFWVYAFEWSFVCMNVWVCLYVSVVCEIGEWWVQCGYMACLHIISLFQNCRMHWGLLVWFFW